MQSLYKISVTLGDAVVNSVESYWKSLNGAFGKVSELPNVIYCTTSFRDAFSSEHERWVRPVVIFIDEFDKLHDEDAADAYSAALSSIREIKNDRYKTIIHSIISIGTFAILELNQTNPFLSPFNAIENFKGMSLTKEQVQDLYKEYSLENEIIIEPEVVEEIYKLTNGYVKHIEL